MSTASAGAGAAKRSATDGFTNRELQAAGLARPFCFEQARSLTRRARARRKSSAPQKGLGGLIPGRSGCVHSDWHLLAFGRRHRGCLSMKKLLFALFVLVIAGQ